MRYRCHICRKRHCG